MWVYVEEEAFFDVKAANIEFNGGVDQPHNNDQSNKDAIISMSVDPIAFLAREVSCVFKYRW